jgi:hypothetical protein
MSFPIPIKTRSAAFAGMLLLLMIMGVMGATQASAVAPRGENESAPGRVLQATTPCDLENGLVFSASPATAKIGEKVRFTAAVKPECQEEVKKNVVDPGRNTFALQHGRNDSQAFQTAQGNGFEASMEVVVADWLFSVGPHAVFGRVSYLETRDGQIYSVAVWGQTQFTAAEAATTGDASLTVGENQNGRAFTYQVQYNKGGSGIDAAAVYYECGYGNPANSDLGKAIECSYPSDPNKTYTVLIQAVQRAADGTFKPIPGAKWTKQVTITGQEQFNTGVSNPEAEALKNAAKCIGPVATPLCVINFILTTAIDAFISVLFYATTLVAQLIEVILAIRTHTDEFAAVIYPGWIVLRNLGNILFIGAIFAAGISTVFRISGWTVKDLVVKLIVGAVLVNFSLTIAQAVLGVADTLQVQFFSDGSGAVRAIMEPLFATNIWATQNPADLGTFGTTVQSVMRFFLAFAAFMAFLGVAGLLVARLFILWIILLTAPLPYIANVLPITKSFKGNWWSKLFSWGFVGAVVGFMLNLTAHVAEENSGILFNLTQLDPSLNNSIIATTVTAVASQLPPMLFMFATVMAGSKFVKGTSGVVDKAIASGARAAFLPAAFVGGAIAGGATKFGKGVATVAKAPITLAGKGVSAGVDKAKDAGKLAYFNQVNKRLGPKDEKDIKGAKGIKGALFNLASGGAVWEASKKARKEDVEEAAGRMKAKAKDIRSLRKGKTARAERAYDDAAMAKEQKDKRDEIKENTSRENIDAMKAMLDSKAEPFTKTVELLERAALALEKNSFDDLKKELVVQSLKQQEATGDEETAKKATARLKEIEDGTRDATIEEFYQAGAAAGIEKRHLEQLRDKVNTKMISENKFDNVIDPSDKVTMVDPEDEDNRVFSNDALQKNQEFRLKRVDKKSGHDMASNFHASMFKLPEVAAHFAYKFDTSSSEGQKKIADAMSLERTEALSEIFKDKTGKKEEALREEMTTLYKPRLVREYTRKYMETYPDMSLEDAMEDAAKTANKIVGDKVDNAIKNLRTQVSI